VFYINVPIGIFALLLAMGHLPKTDVKYLKTDWTGLVLLVFAVGSLQMVLDQGQTRDWFNSRFIQIFTAITLFSSIAFFMRGWNNSKNIVDLSLLKDRNFLAGLLAITAYGVTCSAPSRSAAAHPAAHGLSAMSAGMLFIPARWQRHRAVHHRQLSHAVIDPRISSPPASCFGVGTMMMAGLSLQADGWAIAAPASWPASAWVSFRAAHRGGFRQRAA
jgi:DHA2 family multidrug resistance protein